MCHPMVYRSTPDGPECPVETTPVNNNGAYIFRYASGSYAWYWLYDPAYRPLYGAAESYADAVIKLADAMTRQA